jgi:5-methyltetrahydropteroyltriglutamate--homocysteine methyltransferase
MNTVVDDIGSFPLPLDVDGKLFNKAYGLAREAMINGKDIRKDAFLLNNFYQVIVYSFRKKCSTGLDIVNYPQHYDMYAQFGDIIHGAMNRGTYAVDEKEAIIPEVHVIEQEAKRIFEEIGKKVSLRVCITGPMELYLKEVGTTLYKDIMTIFAGNAQKFAKNAILDSKYVKTEVVSLDEPSFGFQEILADKDSIIDILEKTFDFNGAVKQIHLHSASRVAEILNVKNLDVLSFEYAASPRNIESLSKNMLEKTDKQIRIGISRTDINSIMSELYDKGVTKPSKEQLVESEEKMRKRFTAVKQKYGDRVTFTGPDCGLGGWPTQDAALLLLERTVKAVKSATIDL